MLRWAVYLKGGPNKTLHAAVAVRHNVYSFGGYSIGETYQYNMGQIDVHVFNSVSLRWKKLPPQKLTSSGKIPKEVPSTRVCHTAVLIEDTIYIWGGIVNIETEETGNGVITISGNKCNILYAFDVENHRWFNPTEYISKTVPEARCGHSACALGKVMYIFGGFNLKTGRTNDIYKLDTTSMAWSLINTHGPPTLVSDCHSATIIGTKMFVYGGRGDEEETNYNTIRVFDTETNCWLNTPPTQFLPEACRGHSVFAYKGELYIFGGENFPRDRSFNDLWKFNPERFSWKKVKPKGRGPCAMNSRMCCCMVGERIILFGGYTPDDLYILDLSPSLKTLCKLAVIQHGQEQSELPHDIRWELTSMTIPAATERKIENPEPGENGTEERNSYRDGTEERNSYRGRSPISEYESDKEC